MENSVAKHEKMLERNALMVDTRLGELDQIAIQMSSDRALRPFLHQEEPYKAYLIIKELRKYTYPNSFIDSLHVIFRDDMYLYSASMAQTVSYFFNSNRGARGTGLGVDEDQLGRILYESEDKTVWANGRHIYVAIPIPFQAKMPTRTAVFVIGAQHLLEYFSPERITSLSIVDPEGNMLAGQPVEPGVKGRLISSVSLATGWEYRGIVPAASIDAEIRPIKYVFFISMSAILFFGFLISTVATFYNYLPIKRLRGYLDGLIGKSFSGPDELRSIEESVEQMLQEDRELKRQIADEAPALRQAIIARLLNGSIRNSETLDKAGVPFRKEKFLVAVMQLADSEEHQPGSAISAIIDKSDWLETPGVLIFCAQGFDSSRLIFVISTGDEKGDEMLHRCVDKLREELATVVGGDHALACSSTKSGIDVAGEAYIEAISALEFRFVRSRIEVLRYDRLSLPAEGKVGYPYRIISALREAAEVGAADEMMESLESAIGYMLADDIKPLTVRRCYFDVMSSLIAGIRRWGVDQELPLPDTFALEHLVSFEEMTFLLRQTGERLAEYINQGAETCPAYIRDLRDYVDDQFTNHEISLQHLADKFLITPSHLSSCYKKHFGVNISEHISKLRIDMAKELLAESNHPIKYIVGAAGYSDTSSFIRKFKSVVGMTPGKYRNSNQAVRV